jgi:SAM-dependent methyltransferase
MGVPGATVANFNAWAGDYDHSALQPMLYVPVHHTTLRLALRLVPSPRRILDVGCGTARLLHQARQPCPRAELIGVDPAWQMLTTASARTPAELAVRFVHAAAEDLPFARGTFDLVVATLSLRHWSDRDAGIAQIARVLTPGGVLVVADVFRACQRRPRAAITPRRRCHPVPAELGGVLAAHRLAVVAQDRTPWFALPDVQIIAAQKPHRPAEGDQPPTSRRRLAWFTVGWNALAGLVTIAVGLAAGSIALLGFGADSSMEVFAGVVVLRRLAARTAHPRPPRPPGGAPAG